MPPVQASGSRVAQSVAHGLLHLLGGRGVVVGVHRRRRQEDADRTGSLVRDDRNRLDVPKVFLNHDDDTMS